MDNDTIFRGLPVRSVIGNLPELLLRHLVSDERVALIIEDSDRRYIQFLAREDQRLIVECISNRYLDEEQWLDLDDEMRLLEAGFRAPDAEGDRHPNWWWSSEDPAKVMDACRLGKVALEDVLRFPPSERVTLIERQLTTD